MGRSQTDSQRVPQNGEDVTDPSTSMAIFGFEAANEACAGPVGADGAGEAAGESVPAAVAVDALRLRRVTFKSTPGVSTRTPSRGWARGSWGREHSMLVLLDASRVRWLVSRPTSARRGLR